MRSRNSAEMSDRTGRPKLLATSNVIGWSWVQVPSESSLASYSTFSCGILPVSSSWTLSRSCVIAFSA